MHVGDSLALAQLETPLEVWMTRWIILWSLLDPWGLSTVVHENPKPAAVFVRFVHTTTHTTGLWLM